MQSGGEWTAADLAERLGTSTRTVRRDAQRLRRLGYAVEARPGPGSAYRLRPGVRVPPLLFTTDEITALVAGLHLIRAWLPEEAVASSALLKLDQVLRRRAAATDLATEVLQQPGALVAAETVGVIADAVAEGDRVRFRYTDQHDRRTIRLVEPFRHFLRASAWYLVAFDVDRDDWRTFRLDRIADIAPVAGAFPPRPFPDASIEHWLTTDFGRATKRPPHAPPGASHGATGSAESAVSAVCPVSDEPVEPAE